jgi:hypothetical protein
MRSEEDTEGGEIGRVIGVCPDAAADLLGGGGDVGRDGEEFLEGGEDDGLWGGGDGVDGVGG